MKQRIFLLILALTILLSVPALATEAGMEHFVRSKVYEQQFSDLTEASSFYGNISALYEYGLSVGKTDGTFGLKDSLTVGQAVIFAGRIRSLYCTGDAELGPAAFMTEGQLTAHPYLAYLQQEGVLDDALTERLTAVATRAEMAHILANVLPEEALPLIHQDLVTEFYATGKFIPDVTEYTPYYQDILKLYRCGVSIGSDTTGSFLPDAPITRGAASAMLTRIIDPALRMTPQWVMQPDIPDVSGVTLADLVIPGTYIAAPTTDAEMDESIRCMLSSGSNVLELHYPGISMTEARTVMLQALSATKAYCEQSYNYVTCELDAAGTITLTFSAAGAGDQIHSYRDTSMQAAIAVHDRLWSDGLITADMTETEKARAYFTWICEAVSYDHEAGDNSLSHIPYNLFVNGTAVCDGYTGAYNLLLKLEGISCRSIYTDDHIWTSAVLDGTEVHIDTTWGDQAERGIAYICFAMTPEESRLFHAS